MSDTIPERVHILRLIVDFHDPRIVKRFLSYHHPEIIEFIMGVTNQFDRYENVKFSERINSVLNNVFDRPRCAECTNPTEFVNGAYRIFCSMKCRNSSELTKSHNRSAVARRSPADKALIREKCERTTMERYGVRVPAQSPEVQLKMRTTTMERYGAYSYAQTEEYAHRVKMTNLEKYGVEWNITCETTVEKREQSVFTKYGVTNIVHNHELCKRFFEKKYGVPNPSMAPEVQAKRVKTFKERYGVDNPSKIPRVLTKIRGILEERGRWTPAKFLTDKQKYRRSVDRWTKASIKEYKHLVNPSGFTSATHQVDHIFSVFEGFKRHIDPEIIGHYTNLQMLSASENQSKGARCDKTLEQLLRDFDEQR